MYCHTGLCCYGQRSSFIEYVVGRSVVKALAGALLVKVAQVGGDPLSRLLYCLVRALVSPVTGGKEYLSPNPGDP